MGVAASKKVSKEKIEKMIDESFLTLDSDNSGTINGTELYAGVLLLYNLLNKKLPGKHNDPPTRKEVDAMFAEFDVDKSKSLSLEEYRKLCYPLVKDVSMRVGKNMLIVFAIVPAIAIGTRKIFCDVPHVGKYVSKIPNSAYASVVTAAIAAAGQKTS